MGGDTGFIPSFILNENPNTWFGMCQLCQGKDNTMALGTLPGFTLDDYRQVYTYTLVGLSESTLYKTVGLAFDTYARVFSIIYHNERKNFYIKSATSNDVVEPFIREGSSGTPRILQDNVTVNFGPDFDYQMPYGYLPWSSYLPYHSCHTEIKVKSMIYILVPSLLI